MIGQSFNRNAVLATVLLASISISADLLWHIDGEGSDSTSPLPDLPLSKSSLATEGFKIPQVFVLMKTDVVENNPVEQVEPGLTEAQELSQQGLLRQFQSGDRVYRLSAISEKGQVNAVLAVTDLTGLPQRRVTVAQGTQLGPYQVSRITQQAVYFSRGDSQLWLRVFTPTSYAADLDTNNNEMD